MAVPEAGAERRSPLSLRNLAEGVERPGRRKGIRPGSRRPGALHFRRGALLSPSGAAPTTSR
jgi:hypothetical protein